MRSLLFYRFHRWLIPAAGMAMIVAACGGAQPTATPPPTAVPTRPPTATVPPQPTATAPATARPTATSAPVGQATATAARTATPAPTATPRPTATAAPTATAGPQAKYGGVLKKALTGEAPSWDALREVTNNTQDVLQPTYDQMVTLDPFEQSRIIPQLAESWTVSNDSITYTFKLRRGITFSNGNPLTAQDVKFSYESIVKPPQGVPSPIQSSLSSIDTINTPDDFTVELKLKGPDASLLAALGQGRAAIMDKELVDKEGRERLMRWPPVGTGPFVGKADGWVRSVSATIVRRPDYWVSGRPYLDSAQFFPIPDAGTKLAAFLTGQVNFDFTLVSADEEKEVRGKLGNKLAVQISPTSTWWSAEINTQRPPFNDIRVRKAVALGADKHGFIKVTQRERGHLGGLITPGTGWELPEAELLNYEGYKDDRKANVARAKQLLAEAGFPNGFKTVYFTRNQQSYVDNTVFTKATLDEIGITGDLQIVDSAKFFGDLGKPENWLLSVQGHITPLTDPNSAYQTFHLCKGSRNYTGLCDPKIEEMYNTQNLATDPAKRKAIVWEMERYTLGTYHNIILAFTRAHNAYYANIKNYQFHVSPTSNRQLRDVWME